MVLLRRIITSIFLPSYDDSDDDSIEAWARPRASAPAVVGRVAPDDGDAWVGVQPAPNRDASDNERDASESSTADLGHQLTLIERAAVMGERAEGAAAAVLAEGLESTAALLRSLPPVSSISVNNVWEMLQSTACMLLVVIILTAASAAIVAALSMFLWRRPEFVVCAFPAMWVAGIVLQHWFFDAVLMPQGATVDTLKTSFFNICHPVCMSVVLGIVAYVIVIFAAGLHRMVAWDAPIAFCALWKYSCDLSIISWRRYRHEASEDFRATWEAKCLRAARLCRPTPKRRPQWKSVLYSMGPLLIVNGVGCLFIFGILPLHGLVNNGVYRGVVYTVAVVVVKTGGKKMVARSLETRLGTSGDFVDGILFVYNLAMSLLARLMLLREPDAAALLVLGVLSGIWELLIRALQVGRVTRDQHVVRRRLQEAQDFALVAGRSISEVNEHVSLCKAAVEKHAQHRAVVSTSIGADCIVEYLATNISMLMLLLFEHAESCLQFGTIDLAVDRISLALLAQHGPELVADVVAMTYELSAGLNIWAYFRQQFNSGALSFKIILCFSVVQWIVISQLATSGACK